MPNSWCAYCQPYLQSLLVAFCHQKQAKGMFSGCPSVRPSVNRVTWYFRAWWSDVNVTWHKYSSRKWALGSGWSFPGQRSMSNRKVNGNDVWHFMGVKWITKLKPNNLLVSNDVNASFNGVDCSVEVYVFSISSSVRFTTIINLDSLSVIAVRWIPVNYLWLWCEQVARSPPSRRRLLRRRVTTMLSNDVVIDNRVIHLRLVAAFTTSASGGQRRPLSGDVPVELAVEVA